ncbi:MAG: hypothetical protein AAF553_11890 [Pseudomonadota bacterium]
MAILIVDPTYPEHEDRFDDFRVRLEDRLKSEFLGCDIWLGDAGPSASIPVWMLRLTTAGWFIFSAPATIEQNMPLWREAYDQFTQIAQELSLTYSIDPHDAVALAMDAAASQFSWDIRWIKIVDLHSHWKNLNGVWATHFDLDSMSEPGNSPQFHSDAVAQYACRYFVLIEHDGEAASIIVHTNGDIGSVFQLEWPERST